MWKIIMICLVLLFTACPVYGYNFWKGEFDEWTKEDTYWQISVLVTQIIDWGQTKWACDNYWQPGTGRYELNSFLGKYPTQKKIDEYFIICIFGNWGISYILPASLRRKWQVLSVGLELHCINNNYQLGIGIKF